MPLALVFSLAARCFVLNILLSILLSIHKALLTRCYTRWQKVNLMFRYMQPYILGVQRFIICNSKEAGVIISGQLTFKIPKQKFREEKACSSIL
jgi:hypothetical protein